MAFSPAPLNWGLLATGGIAGVFAEGLAQSRTGRLLAVGSRRQESADAFAKKFGAKRAHGSYEALLADPEIQAIYISTPHPLHAEWAIRAARAGKHVLLEKPFTLTHAEAVEVVKAARDNRVFLMEAFMYRCHPLMARVVELLREGVVGQVGIIRSTFSFKSDHGIRERHLNNALGGGGILDVGCYAVSLARLVAGVACGQPFANPISLTAAAQLHPETGTDLYTVALAQFPNGIFAQLAAGVDLQQNNGLEVFGSEGSLHVPSPFVTAPKGEQNLIHLHRAGKEPETFRIKSPNQVYALEADVVGEAVARGELDSPLMPLDDSLGNMAALDAWRASGGVVYEAEAKQARATKA